VLLTDRGILRRPRVVLAALAVSIGIAALLYLELPLRAGPFRAPIVYGHPETLSGFLDAVFARQFQGDIVGGGLASLVGSFLDLARAQLGPLLYLVPVAFVVTAMRHPRYAAYSGLGVLVACLFAATYANAHIERYYLAPLFFAWSWLAVLGGAIVDRVVGAPADPETAPAVRASRARVSLLIALALLVPTAIDLRDRWSVQDLTHDTFAADWLDETFATVEPDAVVLSWWSFSTPMWYGQLVEGRRPDVTIIDDRTRLDEGLGEPADVIDANLATRPVYVIRVLDSEIQALARRYRITPAGGPSNLYRVTGRTESAP